MEYLSLICFGSLVLVPAFAAPPPARRFTGEIFNERLNLTLPSPFSLSNVPDSSLATEIDPWDMPVPYTTMILEWYGYRDPLNATDAARCVQKALVETTDHLMMGEDHIPLASAPYSHSHAGVRLWWRVAEGKSLSWGIWSRVVYQIPVYGQRNEWRGAQFVVFGAASGDVVNGYLLAE